MNIRAIAKIAKDSISKNIMKKYDLFYITEPADWSIKWDGLYITQNINKFNSLNASTTASWRFIKDKVIHFGSRNLFLLKDVYKKVNSSNKIVFTWFHGSEKDKSSSNQQMINILPKASKYVDLVHTSTSLSYKKLIKWGVPEKKLVLIPLGVDINHFKRVSNIKRRNIKEELNIPPNKIIIGSFQKDGEGWGKGMNPKWVKAPDIFCKVVKKLSQKYNIHVLLTGPARGYVIDKLEKAGISYTHNFLDNYLDINRYYQILDLYIITSREEGGPKAIPESMASGVPLVTTNVGMAPDIIKHTKNALIAKIDDVNSIAEAASEIIQNKNLRNILSKNGLETAKSYSWKKIAEKYYKNIYSKLID